MKPTFTTILIVLLIGSPFLSAQEVLLQLTSMTPHIGQKLEARLIDKRSLKEADRIAMDPISAAAFNLSLNGEIGGSYYVDFYADLNQNGYYDAPPVDHTWRLEIDDLQSGANSLPFVHNTGFVDVEWKHRLVLSFTGMTPHVGQGLVVIVRDLNLTGREAGRVSLDAISAADFDVDLPFLSPGHSYYVDFYADLNQNGQYDAPPADHAWRLDLMEAFGDADLSFSHNTEFMDIAASGQLLVEFMGMTPHVGQLLELRLVEQGSGAEKARIKQDILLSDFELELPGLIPGEDYRVDFYADLNQNGIYDAPPADHAWREEFTATAGQNALAFTHNTGFTDIDWVYQFTLDCTGMNPHVGQQFKLRLVDTGDDSEVGSFSMPAILVPDFKVFVPGLRIGANYHADFYADFNQNGIYDAPPADHAWRENFDDQNGDETVAFTHNTTFTDIEFPASVFQSLLQGRFTVSPNPAEGSVLLEWELDASGKLEVSLYNSLGSKVGLLFEEAINPGEQSRWIKGLEAYGQGLFFVAIRLDDRQTVVPLVLR